MMARRGVLGLLAGGAAMMLGGCGMLFPDRYRFRMTVEVETPEGIKSGSSVYEVKAWNAPRLLPEERSRDWKVTGETVAVDLPGDRTLFALLKTGAIHGGLVGLSMKTLDPAFRNDIVESAQRISSGRGIRRTAEVRPEDYPMLVTFRDIADPKSVERVDPADLAASFGPGHALRSITVEITDEPVTNRIEARLGAFGLEPGHGLDRTQGVTAAPTLAQQLSYADFVRR